MNATTPSGQAQAPPMTMEEAKRLLPPLLRTRRRIMRTLAEYAEGQTYFQQCLDAMADEERINPDTCRPEDPGFYRAGLITHSERLDRRRRIAQHLQRRMEAQ